MIHKVKDSTLRSLKRGDIFVFTSERQKKRFIRIKPFIIEEMSLNGYPTTYEYLCMCLSNYEIEYHHPTERVRKLINMKDKAR